MPHILLVEDNEPVLHTLTETLEAEGWHVTCRADFYPALRLIEGETHVDLFLFDNRLPTGTGIELTRIARGLSHRKETPLIMISASECEREARRAGANEFLRKPEDVSKIVETVRRLLSQT